MRKIVKFAVILCVLSLVDAARSDDWGPPPPRIFAERNGSRAFKILPTKEGSKLTATGVCFYLNKDGTEKTLWRKDLVNVPLDVLMSDSGGFIATFDSWYSPGYEHALIIYGQDGKTICDFTVEDLLTAQEIKDHVALTTSSRRWRRRDTAAFDFAGSVARLRLSFHWGKAVDIDLNTGKVVLPAATEETKKKDAS